MIDDQIIQQRQFERKCLVDVIKCFRYLARQEIPLQGPDNNNNLTQILYLLGTNDDKIFNDRWDTNARIMSFRMNCCTALPLHVLRVKVSNIRERKFFSVMAD